MGRGIAQLCYFFINSSRRPVHGRHYCSWVDDILSESKCVYPLDFRRNKHWFISRETRLSGFPVSSNSFRCGSFRLYATRSPRERPRKEAARSDLTTQEEDPFDSLTDKIPQKPVTFAEGASYSFVILFGFAIAGFAAYGVFKELIFEPKEYKVFNKALNRVQGDNQVTVRIGSPITGYGQDTRNRAARQHIPHRAWSDEDGVQRIEVQFYVRGPHGYGRVHSEMFKDKEDRQWKFTYLIVDIITPSPTRLMLESYVPA